MILSVSRRTDIPALYSDWFMNRLRAGEVLVRNPVNPLQVSSIPLSPENIDCLVFWTKDPRNLMGHLDEIDRMGYSYYFTVSLNPYDKRIEGKVAGKNQIIDSFRYLSDKIGKRKMIWRYDPIIFSPELDEKYHLEQFQSLAEQLGDYTDKCVFSFLEIYRKIQVDMQSFSVNNPGENIKRELIGKLVDIAGHYSIQLASCAQKIDYSDLGVKPNKCIDDTLIEKITGYKIKVSKDKSQRVECGCVASRDIGTYNTCTNGCVYCYANIDKKSAQNRFSRYDPRAPLLCDKLAGNENIAKMKNSGSLKVNEKQGRLFAGLADS